MIKELTLICTNQEMAYFLLLLAVYLRSVQSKQISVHTFGAGNQGQLDIPGYAEARLGEVILPSLLDQEYVVSVGSGAYHHVACTNTKRLFGLTSQRNLPTRPLP